MRYEVVLDRGETPNKCTIAPLAYRQDFRLIRVVDAVATAMASAEKWLLGPLQSQLLLHHQGRCITELRASLPPIESIAAVDCVWRRLDPLLARIQGGLPTLARIPDGFVTAYPRKSELDTDPDGGLATIEAIFVAAALLGNWDATLLEEYHFGRSFVELNARRFVELGVSQASDPSLYPVLRPKVRDARQRRRDRSQRRD